MLHAPELAHGCCQPQLLLGIRRLSPVAIQRGTYVVVLGHQPTEPGDLVVTTQLAGSLFGERQAPRTVPRLEDLRLAGILQPPRGIQAERLQETVARATVVFVHAHQRPIDKPHQQFQDLVPPQRVASADHLGRLERPAASEDRQPRNSVRLSVVCHGVLTCSSEMHVSVTH